MTVTDRAAPSGQHKAFVRVVLLLLLLLLLRIPMSRLIAEENARQYRCVERCLHPVRERSMSTAAVQRQVLGRTWTRLMPCPRLVIRCCAFRPRNQNQPYLFP